MAGTYSEATARVVKQGDVAVVATRWVPLTATGITGLPLEARRHIRYNIKSNPGGCSH